MPAPPPGRFPTTKWTLIARLKSADAEVARTALDEICRQYYYPLYCYIRRRGFEHDDALDALHDFFAKLLRLGSFEAADAGKGRLRGFLATSLQRSLINWRRDQTHRAHECSLEEAPLGAEAEARYSHEGFTEHETPDRAFERKWGHDLMARVLQRLAQAYAEKGKSRLYEALQPALLAGGTLRGQAVPELAASLSLSEGALRVAFSRLLGEFRTLLEEEVFQTVSCRDEVAEEIRYLMQLFKRG